MNTSDISEEITVGIALHEVRIVSTSEIGIVVVSELHGRAYNMYALTVKIPMLVSQSTEFDSVMQHNIRLLGS